MPQDRGQKLKQKDPEQPEAAAQKRKKRRSRVWRVLVCILAVLAAGMSALAVHVYLSGKNLRKGAAAPNLEAFAPQTQTEEETDAPQDKQPPRLTLQDDNTVLVDGKRYRFNDEVQTFLLLGIDSYTPEQSDGSCNVHAFSDVIMLAAMDFRSNRISLISLSRDTMCEFQRLNPDGTERDRAYGQLALAFSYGEGKEKSCEITKDAVSRIMSELPIRSCSALYLNGLDNMPVNYREDVIRQPEIARIIQLTSMYNEPKYDNLPTDMGVGPAFGRITTVDGRVLTRERVYPDGHLTHPIPDQGIHDKYMKSALPVLGQEKAEELYRRLMALEEERDIRALLALCR